MTLTKFEIARIIGVRATQLEQGAPPMIDIGDLTDSLSIATAEYEQKTIPFVIIRTYPNGTKVEIDPNTGDEIGREPPSKKSSV